MALDNNIYDVTKRYQIAQDNDRKLLAIFFEIDHYLKNLDQQWAVFVFGRIYQLRCVKSWANVCRCLEKFLRDPRTNYSLLMSVLDKELTKFPVKSHYRKKLVALSDLIAMGPLFTLTQNSFQKSYHATH